MSVEELTAGASLSLRELHKRYGDFEAVKGVSLHIEPGEFVTLLGPSGSGKTTTLNMIAGFADVTEGDIQMDGRPITNLRPHRRDIGMVFQNYALFPHMTAWENVAFPLKQRKMRKAEIREKVREALAMVRLETFGDRYPRELSGGQQQRVALARAIVFSPKVLLMDEPLGALDKKLREWLQLEIRRLHRQLGITFVYVTHDQEEALVLSDRIAVFNEGVIEQVGTAAELYERPETLFVAEFIGDSNVFPGRVVRNGDRTELEGSHWHFEAPGTDLPHGSAAVVVVRPERIRLVESEGARAGNVLEGQVREVIYLGASRKVELELPGGLIVRARETASAQTSLAVGDTALVCWAPRDSVLLANGDAGAAEVDDLAAVASGADERITSGHGA